MQTILDLKQNLSLRIIGPSRKLYCFEKGQPLAITNALDIRKFLSMKDVFFETAKGNPSKSKESAKPKSFSKMDDKEVERPELTPSPNEKAKVIRPDSEKNNMNQTQETEEEKLQKEKPFLCKICQERFKTSQALASHTRYTHDKKVNKRSKRKAKK